MGFIINIGLILTPFFVFLSLFISLIIINVLFFTHTSGFLRVDKNASQVQSFDAYLQTSSVTQTLEYYRQVLQLQPTHRDLLLNTATLLNKTGQSQTAKLLEEQAQLIDPLVSYQNENQ